MVWSMGKCMEMTEKIWKIGKFFVRPNIELRPKKWSEGSVEAFGGFWEKSIFSSFGHQKPMCGTMEISAG